MLVNFVQELKSESTTKEQKLDLLKTKFGLLSELRKFMIQALQFMYTSQLITEALARRTSLSCMNKLRMVPVMKFSWQVAQLVIIMEWVNLEKNLLNDRFQVFQLIGRRR
jgi:hypothetical protein